MNKAATPKHFEGFIFDLDGTLLNTLPDLVVVTNKALKKEGFPPHSEADILRFVGDGVMSLVLQAIPECASEDQAKRVYENFRSMYTEYGLSLTAFYCAQKKWGFCLNNVYISEILQAICLRHTMQECMPLAFLGVISLLRNS